jgi:ABC-type multidrug transport system ATPase subunit/ABC-type multidrug transport system permease subunit
MTSSTELSVHRFLILTHASHCGGKSDRGSSGHYFHSDSFLPYLILLNMSVKLELNEISFSKASPSTLQEDFEEAVATTSANLVTTNPLSLICKDVNYAVKIPTKDAFITKPILHNISANFESGSLTAVLGPSGAGKSSFLRVLSGRYPGIVAEGAKFFLNSNPVHRGQLIKMSGFVNQQDILFPTQTVEEAVSFSSHLKTSKSIPGYIKTQRIQSIISDMNLDRVRHNIIGSVMVRGLSGGERRRVSLAVEMVAQANLLFLDEPTSGLDLLNAYSVMKLLYFYCKIHQRTIITSIHQPNSDVFQLIDNIIVLHQGSIVFNGKRDNLVPYFSKFDYYCPNYVNPVDFLFMTVFNNIAILQSKDIEEGKEESKQSKDSAQLSKNWAESKENIEINESITEKLKEKGSLPSEAETNVNDATAWEQFFLLMKRAWKNQFRSTVLFRGKLYITIITAILIGLIFLQLGSDQKSINNRLGVIMFIVVNTVSQASVISLNAFSAEKIIFITETMANLYSVTPYYFSRVLIQLPFQIVFSLLKCLILYWLIGLQAVASKFFTFFATVILMEFVGGALGTLFSCLVAQIQVALLVIPLFLMPFTLFSGFYINLDSVTIWLRWLSYISPMKWGYIAMIKNEFEGLDLHCNDGQYLCSVTRGEQVIQFLNFDSQVNIAECEVILLCMAIGLYILAYLALVKKLGKR